MNIETFYYLGSFFVINVYVILSCWKKMKKIVLHSIIFFSILYSSSAALIYINQVYVALVSSLLISFYVGLMYHYDFYKNRFKQRQDMGLGIEVIILLLIFAISLLYYYVNDNFALFEISLLISSAWSILRSKLSQKFIEDNYLKNAKLTFSLILLTFLLMWFLGIDTNLALGVLTFSDLLSSNLAYILYNFLTGVTATPWFYIIVGIWLGILSFYRMVDERKFENKIRMLLMIIAYWIYSLYIPSFSPISNKVQYIPYMWYSGLGTYGPVSPSVVLTGIVGTYVVTAVLSALFGSRQICSVTCTAPYMLQGTFFNSLKSFNRNSKLGRKTLTSKISWWFRANAIVLWTSLLALAVISYLNQIGLISFTIFGNDPTVFLTSLYFNFLWWVQFIGIPFFGNYACVTQGLCHWGLFNQFFSYVGRVYRLKVKDPAICLNCKTVDCAKACPTGLTDMRASFIKKGEFRSFKCIGVGDCVEACPYDNIYIYDIRHKIRELRKEKII
ncbi:putative integral membrane 4Fe-4S protein [Saccharolobus shibatae B12]|uniref:Integral membrane 4Fe-4S protein n=1 Tax=Saccharolobus shibatae (strain ATCC 51178 / DSM 5389 / JCM 8931 / NBRC 15437 / B12) TaxID=523848 RepID=A0A8F5GSV4_SACSH|nr:4Fe-4S binding protein [Saccharolobus shibatae]QXJ27722.1 putative integral membrane 4Fe-4S protein [Saccharolobus shibatae B12]